MDIICFNNEMIDIQVYYFISQPDNAFIDLEKD